MTVSQSVLTTALSLSSSETLQAANSHSFRESVSRFQSSALVFGAKRHLLSSDVTAESDPE